MKGGDVLIVRELMRLMLFCSPELYNKIVTVDSAVDSSCGRNPMTRPVTTKIKTLQKCFHMVLLFCFLLRL